MLPTLDISDLDEGWSAEGLIHVISPSGLAGARGDCCGSSFFFLLGIIRKDRILELEFARAGLNLANASRIFFLCFSASLRPVEAVVVVAGGAGVAAGVAAVITSFLCSFRVSGRPLTLILEEPLRPVLTVAFGSFSVFVSRASVVGSGVVVDVVVVFLEPLMFGRLSRLTRGLVVDGLGVVVVGGMVVPACVREPGRFICSRLIEGREGLTRLLGVLDVLSVVSAMGGVAVVVVVVVVVVIRGSAWPLPLPLPLLTVCLFLEDVLMELLENLADPLEVLDPMALPRL